MAGLYACWHGPEGLKGIATTVRSRTAVLADALRAAGLRLRHETFFDTVTVDGVDADVVLAAAAERGFDLRRVADDAVGVSLDETSSLEVVSSVISAFGIDFRPSEPASVAPLADGLRRTSEFMTQSIFGRLHTEHEMLRYLRRLADRDLALDRTMIPLGSCTMKLNATTEMASITWPEFANLHPFAPEDESVGTRQMIAELEGWLAEITGYDAVTVQPNAGSQGELAGLLAIRAYHRSRGEEQRTVCLIPASAHGTNAASAVMAGMDVVVVATDVDGNVDLDDLAARLAELGDRVGTIMTTYPSTHGVFEERISEMCAMVHDAGGQVYVDGANLNALVGLAKPGTFGADVSHLNLHKTFCIPHGGGGPGVGPIGVRAHLAPFLPGDPLAGARPGCRPGVGGQVRLGRNPEHPVGIHRADGAGRAAPRHGRGDLLGELRRSQARRALPRALHRSEGPGRPRVHRRHPWTHEGDRGHRRRRRQAPHRLRVPRPDDELPGRRHVHDRADRERAARRARPVLQRDDRDPGRDRGRRQRNLARRPRARCAWPRTPPRSSSASGSRPYARELGAYPVASLRAAKYFPPVSRIDGAGGDRNLVCSCEPLEAYAATLA